ncbi:MAG: FG-GAP-like repeat-containing protein [Candidatus Berkelbacteria bacterium]|nr:FG-GAP-like repeat-containing protein [Candidatus Berkelbacteria bacterium]
MKKEFKILIILSTLIFMLWPATTSAGAPINTLYQRDNAISQGYGQNIRLDGDLDGDGIDDFVVSAISWNFLQGRVFIYWGGSSLSASPDVTIEGEGGSNQFGDGMAVGDFNGDNIDDLAIGAIGYGANRGRSYIFYGRSRSNWLSVNSANQANVIISGEVGTIGHFGNKMALGDVNLDGYDDFLIGAEWYDVEYEGRAYLFYGEVTDPLNLDASAADLIINNDFGAWVTSALGTEVDIGDIGGDSHPDIIIAVDSWLTGGLNPRAISIWGSGSLSGTKNASESDLIITGGAGFELFSYPVRSADLNNDGKEDLIAGADHFGIGGGGARMSIFLGGPSLSGAKTTADADAVIIGENLASSDLFSMAIATGDINNDSIDDLIVSAYYYPDGSSAGEGRLYVFFGGEELLSKISASQADYAIDPPAGYDRFGWWVSAGDINGDGWDEFCSVARLSGVKTTAYIFSLSHIPPVVTISGPTINYANNRAEVRFTGNAADPDGGNIEHVQYSLDGGSWQNAIPVDGSFGSTSEDYYFDLMITTNGTHTIRARATDSENATTLEANYAVSSFIVIGILPESGQSLIDYINNLLL